MCGHTLLVMRSATYAFILSIWSLPVLAATPDCAALSSVPLEKAQIKTQLVTSNKLTIDQMPALENLPNFCRVSLTLEPSTDSKISVEIWLPAEGWNGRLQGIGNGGYAGSINWMGLAQAIRAKYAAVATDTGHQGEAMDASWALNHPEKIVDFGYRAIHLMTANAHKLVQAFYGTPAAHSYFNSCSNGGRQALMEAQRFPDDYDGIIAGAPANYWTHLLTNGTANAQAFLATPKSAISAAKLPAIQAAAQKTCDLNDGVQDNVIENPARCRFDTSVLLCRGPETDACLSSEALATLNKLYAGGHLSNGKLYFPGYVPGGEAAKGNWELWITGSSPATAGYLDTAHSFSRTCFTTTPTGICNPFTQIMI